MKLRALALIPLLALTAPAYANTKIISYVETSGATSSDPVVNFTSGQIARQDAGGAINHAVSGVGTNKLYGKGNGTSELNAASAWMDSYTVGGTGTVDVHLSFTVDGKSAVGANGGGDGNPFDWSYRVVALKGNNWTLGGQGETRIAPGTGEGKIGLPIRSPGDNYESLLLTAPSPNDAAVTATFQPRFGVSTVWSVRDFGLDDASFASGISRSGSNMNVTILDSAGRTLRLIYQPSQLRITDANTGAVLGTQPYTLYPAQRDTYQRLLTQYPILGQTGLCTLDDDTGLCPAEQTYGPTEMNLNFSLQAGDTFTLLSYLSFINLRDGEFDFFNTAKLSGISVTPGATITSASGALQQNSDGSFGYKPLAIAGVPEPANWALMIGGFGLIGGAARRRQRQAASAASIAVAAPRVA